jgi:hypothetical protein
MSLFQKLIAAATVMLLCVSFASNAEAQDQTRFVLKLNDDLVSKLRDVGSLASVVRDQFRQRISLIEVQYADSADKPAQEASVDLEVSNGTANVIMDERLIQLVQKGPVRISVPQDKRAFSRVSLVYASSRDDGPRAPAEPILNSAGQPIDMYYIRLKEAKGMAGGIDGFDRFEIETKFGNVSMPMDQVAGIKFHIDGKDSAVVVLDNGDTVTGVPTIPAVKLQTDIEPEFMNALTTTPNAKFTQANTDFGLRWELKTGDSFAPGN